jgi:hypothetical protein
MRIISGTAVAILKARLQAGWPPATGDERSERTMRSTAMEKLATKVIGVAAFVAGIGAMFPGEAAAYCGYEYFCNYWGYCWYRWMCW